MKWRSWLWFPPWNNWTILRSLWGQLILLSILNKPSLLLWGQWRPWIMVVSVLGISSVVVGRRSCQSWNAPTWNHTGIWDILFQRVSVVYRGTCGKRPSRWCTAGRFLCNCCNRFSPSYSYRVWLYSSLLYLAATFLPLSIDTVDSPYGQAEHPLCTWWPLVEYHPVLISFLWVTYQWHCSAPQQSALCPVFPRLIDELWCLAYRPRYCFL